jgi:hypothetical protein
LYTFGERPEIADALKFVIRKLDVEMLFQARQEIERLQAVNAQSLEKIVIRAEPFARHFEMRRGKLQDFVRRFVDRRHTLVSSHILRLVSAVCIDIRSCLRQIGECVGALHKFAKPRFHRGPRKQIAKDVYLAP